MLRAARGEVSRAVQAETPSSTTAAREAWLWPGAAADSSSLADITMLSELQHEDASIAWLQ